MKKTLLFLCFAALIGTTYGQLSGTKTIPGDYPTIAAAVTALNTQGVGPGGVIFNVAAGYTETLTGRIDLTATGTFSNQIIFQKNGFGADPLITSYSGTALPGSATPDGMWSLTGCDYVTIDGIDLQEAAGNNTPTLQMEYGYGIFKASGTDGASNNRISSCTITLNRDNSGAGAGPFYNGSTGIVLMACTPTTATTVMTVTATTGASSSNKIYYNTIQNVNCGIALSGYAAASPFTLADANNDIGGATSGTGNFILNFGGGASATNPAAGIYIKDQWGFNASYNTINNNNGSGVNHGTTLRGIYTTASTSASGTLNNNTLTIKGGGTTTQISVIENTAGATAAGNTISINNNTITGCTNATNTTGVWYGIWNSASATNLNIQSNTFSGNTTNTTTAATYLIYNNGACPGTINLTGNQISQAFQGATAYSGTLYSLYNSSGTTATTCNITGNNFSNYSFVTTGTGSLYFIYNTNSNANLNISSNTWTALSLNHSGSEYLMYNSSNTQVALNVSNNSVVTSFTRTAAAGSMYCYYAGSSSLPTSTQTFTGNNFSNITANTSGAGTFYGMYNSDGATSPYPKKAVYNNTISNVTYNTTGTFYGFYTSYLGDGSTASGSSIYNNTVSNVTVSGTVYGLYPGGTVSPTYQPSVYGNVVNNITTNGAASSLYACYLAGGGAGLNFFKNKVYTIAANGATGYAYGIYLTSAVLTNLFNNLVGDVKAPTSSQTAPAPSVVGMYLAGTTVNAYYNTVYLNATGTGTNFGTAAVYASTSPTVTLRNNIFVNLSTPNGTGKTIAYQRSSTTLGTYGAASNNNDFYAGTPGPNNLIMFDGTNSYQTMTDFKGAVSPRDASSISENPNFLSTTGSNPSFLHINTTIPTQLESGAVNITNITDDFDGDIRQGNAGYTGSGVAPDIGGDEFNGIFIDLTPPNIGYTPFMNTSSTTARTLIATITDATGVPTSGIGLPRLYWKINSGSWNSATAVSLGGNQYSFTFGAGVVLNDVVSYYLVAQDLVTPTPNVGANPSAGAAGLTANPPAAGTPPTTPYTYTIVGALCGNYNVGTGQVYTTLTAAVADLNLKEITCPVTLTLTDATYSAAETFPLVINSMAGASSTNTVTIKPASGVSPVISGNSSTAILKLNGANYLIIDGSNSGGTSRNLTIANTATSGTTAAVWVASNGTGLGSTNDVIKNCIVSNGYNTSGAYGFFIGASSGIGTAGDDNDNLTIQNNAISKCYYGIYCLAGTTGLLDNLLIRGNTLGSTTATDYIGYQGMYLSGAVSPLVAGNEIYNMITSTSTYQTGIELYSNLSAPIVWGNLIHDLQNNNTGGWGAYGINIGASSNVVGAQIINNVIYNITTINYSTSSTTYNPFGIRIVGGTGHKIWGNTVHMKGTQFNSGTSGSLSAALLVTTSSVTGMDIRDNIFANGIVGLTGSKSYTVYVPTGTTFSSINFNDYWAYGSFGVFGYFGADVANLAGWQTATGQDGASVSMDPLFVSGTDMHPTNPALNNLGVYLTAVPTDYTGALRTSPPDIGAYEFGYDPVVNTTAATGITNITATGNGTINAAGLSVNSFFDYGLTTAYGSSVAGSPATVTGTTTTPVTGNLTGLTALTTYHYRARGVAGGLTIFGPDMTFTTLANPPTMTTTAATGILATSATLNGTANANGSSTTTSFEYGLTTAYGSTVAATPSPVTGNSATPISAAISSLQPNTLYHYRSKGTNAGGTSYGSDMTFTTAAAPPVVTTDPASNILTNSATMNGTVMANNSSTTVTFEWGLTTSYGNVVGATPGTVTGMTPTAVSANLSGLLTNTTYHYRCVGVNAGGPTYGLDQSFLTGCPPVGPAGTITGPNSVCANSTGKVYSIAPIPNATGYVWTVPTGANITLGQNTTSITVTFGTTSGNVSVYGTGPCGNGAASNLAVTVNPLPVPTITGPASACNGSTGNTYTTQSGMTGYTWTVTGGTISGGGTTNVITVTWTATGNQTVTVNYTNASGCTALTPGSLTVNVLAAPSPTITGPTSMCVNSGYYNYSTQTGMTGYVWTISGGGSITYGQGTSQIQVSWTQAGAQWVAVNYNGSNGCPAPQPTQYAVTVNPLPGTAGNITGSSSVCGGATGVAYSVPPIADATTYVWTLPVGASIASGAGTNAITVDYADNASSGAITVYGNNLCGNGTASPPLNVTVTAMPADPGAITGQTSVCQSVSGLVYSVANIANATGYTWTVPPGASIVGGNNTSSITVDFSASATSGDVTVTGTNSCGNGPTSTLAVTVYPIPAPPVITLNLLTLESNYTTGNQWYFNGGPIPGATGQTYEVNLTGTYWCVETANGCSSDTSNHIYVVMTGIGDKSLTGRFSVQPNPNDGRFTVVLQGVKPGNYTLDVHNSLGVKVWSSETMNLSGTYQQTIDLRPVAQGVYTLILRNTNSQEVRKILISY